MSYDRADLGYELGYDSEPGLKTTEKSTLVAFPEQITTTYSFDPKPDAAKKTPPAFGGFPIQLTDPQGSPLVWDEKEQKFVPKKTDAPPSKDDKSPAPTGDAPKPAAPPPEPKVTGFSTKGMPKDKVKIFYEGGKTEDVDIETAKKKSPDFAAQFADPKKKKELWPDSKTGAPTDGTKLATVEQKSPPLATPVDNKFGYDIAPDQTPATGPLLKKFGAGNEKEAGAYLRLYPYPTAKSRPGLSAPKLKEEQAAWQAKLEKDDLPTIRKNMRHKEVDVELGEYQKLGIPPNEALGRMRAEGKIEWDDKIAMPTEWPKKGEAPIASSTLKVKDGWDVSEAQRKFDAEKAELGKIPVPKKKGEPATARVDAVHKQTQRLQIYGAWSEKMMKEQGYTQKQCDAIIGKMEEKYKLSAMEPTQVAGYFFTGPGGKAEAPQVKELTPEMKEGNVPSRLTDQGIKPSSFFAVVPPPSDKTKSEKYYKYLRDDNTNLKETYRNGNARQWLVAYRDTGWNVGDAYADLKQRGVLAADSEVPKEWPQGDVSQYQPSLKTAATMTPDKVEASQTELAQYKAQAYSAGGKFHPDAKAKVPNIGGEPIKFTDQLPKTYVKGTAYEPLTAATIEVHQGTVAATDEAKAAQGIAPGTGPGAKKADEKKDKGAVAPPEVKGDKWLRRWNELDGYAGEVTDKAFAEAGFPPDKSKPGTTAEAKGDWKIPGASEVPGSSSDPKLDDALALERNRMRQLGFSDPEIAEYQKMFPGRSIDDVQKTFPAPKEEGWNAVGEADKKKALEKYRGEIKEYKGALDSEGQRMKTMGFSDAEITEYQRQNPGRKPDEIGKSFPVTDTSGAAIPKEQLDKTVTETRSTMRTRLIADTAASLKKMDPSLSDENAQLMAKQMYRERTKGGSDDEKASLDGMIAVRKDVQDDLHLISENPKDRIGKLKSRAATHETLAYYGDARKMVEGDKDLKKFYGETDAGQHNLELYAASRGIDMTDPAQVAGLRKEMTRDKLVDFSKTYAEAPKGKPENTARKELEEKYSKSPSGGEGRKKPDLRGMNDKEKSEKEWQLYIQQNNQDYNTVTDEKKHKWEKESKDEERQFSVNMKRLEYKQQIKQMILQHEMQKDQTLFSTMLNLGAQQLNQITQGLTSATQANAQAMTQAMVQEAARGAPPSGKDIYLAMMQKARF